MTERPKDDDAAHTELRRPDPDRAEGTDGDPPRTAPRQDGPQPRAKVRPRDLDDEAAPGDEDPFNDMPV
jgi:hypothetical protein